MKCPKCEYDCETPHCGMCGTKMYTGPGGRCLDRTEANLKQNREAATLITDTLAREGLEKDHRKNLVADNVRVQSRIKNYSEEAAWLKRHIADDAESEPSGPPKQ